MKNFIFFLPLLLASCFSNVDPKLQAHYIDIKSQFKKPLTKHFPKNLPNEFQGLQYSSGLAQYEVSSFLELETHYLSKSMFNSVKNKLITKYLSKISPSDTCLIKVFSGSVNSENELVKITTSLNKNCSVGFPIPDFVINESKSRDDNFYVIEADSINYFGKSDDPTFQKLFSKSERPLIKYLPDKWSKGYSCGITTNDDSLTIDYWLIIW